MSQPATSSRLNNTSVNINGAAGISTNFGLQRIGVTGNSFDISSSSGTVTLGITGTGNVQLGNSTSGAVSFPGTTTFTTLNSPGSGTDMSVGGNLTTGVLTLGSTASTTNLYGTLDITNIEGPTGTSNLNIGRNITSGSITIGNTASNNTVTIGNNGVGPTGTVNVGLSAGTIAIGNAGVNNTVIIGNTGTGPTGAVNVGVSSGIVNVGLSAGTIAIGNGAVGNTINIGNTGPDGATGIINLGTSSSIIRIGTGGGSSIRIGHTASGSVNLYSPLTLGAAPTANTQLGYIDSISLTFLAANSSIGSVNNLYTWGSFTFSNIGVWIVHFYLGGGTDSNPQAVGSIYSGIGVGGSAPYATIATSGTVDHCFASGSFVTSITATTTFYVRINVFSGTVYTQKPQSAIKFIRIG